MLPFNYYISPVSLQNLSSLFSFRNVRGGRAMTKLGGQLVVGVRSVLRDFDISLPMMSPPMNVVATSVGYLTSPPMMSVVTCLNINIQSFNAHWWYWSLHYQALQQAYWRKWKDRDGLRNYHPCP